MLTTVLIATVFVAQIVIIFGFVLLERREPHATLAWIFAVVFLPIIGIIIYLAIGLQRTVRRHRLAERVEERTRHVFHKWQVAQKARRGGPAHFTERTRALVELGIRASGAHASPDNAVAILQDGAASYAAMRAAIEGAQDHIHVEFYIIQPDETGAALRALLVAKAQAGVAVRVLCDALGSLKLPGDYWAPLVAAGGQAAFFAPLRLAPIVRHRDHVNFRNHRKIVVVDGKVGLTGGINIGREYLGLDPQIGAWRDTHVRIEGAAVLTLQQTFIEDWLITTDELLDHERYFPAPPRDRLGTATVQVLASGPDLRWAAIHQLQFLAVAQAHRRVWLTTPYFVPDRVIQTALVTAALRGVDVRLLVPLRSDSRLVDWASRAYFPELLEAGVRIYLYEAGFIHAKTMVVDSWVASIGSANMDIRSFQLNYELTAYIYDHATAEELAHQFEDDLAHAEELGPGWARELSYFAKMRHAFAGLLSPLL